jgi:hypothetical protein
VLRNTKTYQKITLVPPKKPLCLKARHHGTGKQGIQPEIHKCIKHPAVSVSLGESLADALDAVA